MGVGLGSSNKSDPSWIAGVSHILATIVIIHFIINIMNIIEISKIISYIC